MPLLYAGTGDRPHSRVAKEPPIGEVSRDLRGDGVPFKTLAISGAVLGMLIAAPLDAEAATAPAESTVVATASVQLDPPARDTSDWTRGRRNDSYGIAWPGVAAAPPPIDVDGIDDPAVRAVATTVLNIVAHDVQHRLVPPPSRLEFEARSCGENSQHFAYWDRTRRAIGLCSELIQNRLAAETSYRGQKAEHQYYGRASPASNNRFATYDATQSLLFIAYHELGHALVDIYDLDVYGNEEIAVDGFATWWAIRAGATSAAVHGAMTFDQFGMIEDQNPNFVSRTGHGRSTDRYRNIACWLVGAGHSVPEHFREDLGADGESFCQTSYRRLVQQWTRAFNVYDPEAYRGVAPAEPDPTS